MPQIYTPHDRLLCTDGGILLALPKVTDSRKGVQANNVGRIQFQFPPKIKEDSRGGSWNERATTGPTSSDPIATYEHADPRKISMDWTYIVDGDAWPAAKIQTQLYLLRKYFVNGDSLNAEGGKVNEEGLFAELVVKLRIGGMGGKDKMSFRFTNVSIKHGDTLVGEGEDVFHLRTDVSAQLRSWPIILNVDFKGTKVQAVDGMIKTPNDWY